MQYRMTRATKTHQEQRTIKTHQEPHATKVHQEQHVHKNRPKEKYATEVRKILHATKTIGSNLTTKMVHTIMVIYLITPQCSHS